MKLTAIILLVVIICSFSVFVLKVDSDRAKQKDHNIVIRYNGKDKEIPKDGQLLIIKTSLEDTIIVEPATLDDCRRILEENGQG